jgi:hypothetical protein
VGFFDRCENQILIRHNSSRNRTGTQDGLPRFGPEGPSEGCPLISAST